MRPLEGPGRDRQPEDWQNFCTQVLMECVRMPDRDTRIAEWNDARRQLLSIAKDIIAKPLEKRIIIAGADLANRDLSGLDFSYCYFVRTSMEQANVQSCSFRYALLRDTTILLGADLRGADFDRAAAKDTNLLDARVDRHTRLGMLVQENVSLSPDLEQRIRRDRASLATRHAAPLVRLVYRITGYGYGAEGVLALSAIMILLFGLLYWKMDASNFTIGVASDHLSISGWTFLFLSIERFFNASPWLFGTSTVAHLATTAETMLGLFLLSLLVAILARQFMRW